MRRDRTGQYISSTVAGASFRAFVPSPLPPEPALQIHGELAGLLDRANLALGRLDAYSGLLPGPNLLLYSYVRKEAVLSSQIEGTQSSLSDLMLFELDELPGVPFDDVVEVSNYVAALDHGIERLRAGFPISNRLMREMHEKLLSRGRGQHSAPGEFRRSQNWIGGKGPADAHFVPPPPHQVEPAMGELERFLHNDPVRTPTLIKAALAHVQFETIHPFLDGNGRVGRLLITLLLCSEGVLKEPLLYLSLYFKSHRARYYELLDRVRTEGDWEAWLTFFAEGVESTATEAVAAVQRLHALAHSDRQAIQDLGRLASSALRVHEALLARPLNNIARIAEATGLSVPAVTKALGSLITLGLVNETTGRKRGRVFAYTPYLAELMRGM